MRSSILLNILILFVQSCALSAFGATAPKKLDFLVYEVSGQTSFARPGEVISLYWGDVLKINKIYFGQPKKSYEIFLGWEDKKAASHRRIKPLGPKNELDTGTFFFNVNSSLSRNLEKTGDLSKNPFEAELIVKVGNITMGRVALKVIYPELKYFEVTVNEVTQVLRENKPLKVKATDLFKVRSLATNPSPHNDIFYEIVQDNDQILLQLKRNKIQFATLVLDVER